METFALLQHLFFGFLEFMKAIKTVAMRQSLMFSTFMIGMLLSGTLAHGQDWDDDVYDDYDYDYEGIENSGDLDESESDDDRKCSDCTTCCNTDKKSCVSGEMQVEEQTRGVVRVSQLSNGDIIRGIMGADRIPTWCKVEAVYQVRTNRPKVTTYDGFTEDHLVLGDNSVRQYGNKGKSKKTALYTLATECDAAVNAAGQAFTPISTAFCPHEMSWSEYLTLIAAIRRVTSRTGYFWYYIDAFHDNETAEVPYWMAMLHDMCTELLRCAREGRCQKFEKLMEEFVREHLNQEYVAIVERAFPNMGGDVDKSEDGTFTEVVRPQEKSHTFLFFALGSAMVVILAITIIAVLVYIRTRVNKKKKQMKEPLSSHPPVNV